MGRRRSSSHARRLARHQARLRGIARARLAVVVLALVAALPTFGCAAGLGSACAMPRDVLLFVVAALAGTGIGLSIRLVRERRRPDDA